MNEIEDNKTGTLDFKFQDDYGTFSKFKRTSGIIDAMFEKTFFSQYGIQGIKYGNLEQVYDPMMTGIGSMFETRKHLLAKGMTPQFADLLAARYIK